MFNKNNTLTTNQLNIGYINPIISNIDFELTTGTILPILGANGSGKTTFLKTITGFIEPINGEIIYNDKKINQIDLNTRSSLFSIGLNHINPPFKITVKELLQHSIQKKDKIRNNKIDQNIINLFEIEQLLDKDYNTLSDGQKQRVNTCRAILQNTPFIYLDEPTASLDPTQKLEMLLLLKNYAEENNKGILFTVHDLEMALSLYSSFILIGNENFKKYTKNELFESTTFHDIFSSKNFEYNIYEKKIMKK